MMTKDEAIEFSLGIVPTGVFRLERAKDWCDFLNYIHGTELYHPIKIEDINGWGENMYGVFWEDAIDP